MPSVLGPRCRPVLSPWSGPGPRYPATPYDQAERVAEALDGAVLLTYEGDGHGVVASGVACIDDAVAAYLVDLELPDEGATCSS